MIDKLWFEWQQKSKKNAVAIHGGLEQRIPEYTTYPVGSAPPVTYDSLMPVCIIRPIHHLLYSRVLSQADNLFKEWPVKDVMSTTAGPLCYVYS